MLQTCSVKKRTQLYIDLVLNMSSLIGIDAGHGESNRKCGVYDPGAVFEDEEFGLIYREADITFFYSQLLGSILEENGYKVFQTRPSIDSHVPLSTRVSSAEDAGCDLLISIHTNAFSIPTASGCEVLYRDHEKDSSLASTLLAGVINSGLRIRSRGLKKRDNLSLLKFSKPVALLELGFITNEDDRKKLFNLTMSRKICDSLVAHIKMFEF